MGNFLEEKQNVSPFMTGYVLSAFGYEFIFFVMTIYVYNLTKNALDISVFTALLTIAKMMLPLCGAITDRYKKENSFGFAAFITGILITLLFFIKNVILIYVLWFLVSFFFTFISNVRTALMTEIMPEKSYLRGNSTAFILLNIAKINSPLIGGLLTGLFDPKFLLLITGLLYFITGISSKFIKLPMDNAQYREETSMIDQIKQAVHFVKTNTNLRALCLLLFSRGIFLGYQATLFVVYIRSGLSLGSKEYGLFLTMAGMGSIIGSLIGPVISRKCNNAITILAGLTLHYVTFIMLGFNKDYHWALVIIFFSYIAFYVASVAVHSIRDSSTERTMRGTVYGSITAINAPLSVISTIAGGYLINIFGTQTMLIFCGITAMIGLCPIGFVFNEGKNNRNVRHM